MYVSTSSIYGLVSSSLTLIILGESVSDDFIDTGPLGLSGTGGHLALLDFVSDSGGCSCDGSTERVHGGDFVFLY